MKKTIFTKSIIILLLISIVVSATGMIYSFVRPEKIYATTLPVPGIKTTFFGLDACKCPVTDGADCVFLLTIPWP